jgi:hypothetical protein
MTWVSSDPQPAGRSGLQAVFLPEMERKPTKRLIAGGREKCYNIAANDLFAEGA